MMLGTYYIGYEGIRKSALTWQGLRWGLAQGYISHADILRYASERLKEDSTDLEYELYQCKPDHTYRIDGILAELAQHEDSPELATPTPEAPTPATRSGCTCYSNMCMSTARTLTTRWAR